MKSIKYIICCFVALFLLAAGCAKTEKAFEPKYVGGYPTAETAEAMFEEYDYQAAVQFYIWAYAYLNNMGMEKGLAKMGGDERSFYIFDKRIQPRHIIMTANAEVIYTFNRFIDLSKGPVVFEVPPRSRGHFYDFGMRAYVDTGDVGPDKGQGGKYLVVPSDYEGEIPEGYFEVRSEYSDRIMLVFRTFPASEGSDEAAVKLSKQAKWYYLSEADNPPENSKVLIGDRHFSQEWPRDEEAFAWLAEVFNMDKVPDSGLAHMGNMRRLGIEKGKPFNPDERAEAILKRAAKTAEATVLSMAFRNRQDGLIYDNRQYDNWAFVSDPTFYQEHCEEVEERAIGWHQLVGNFATYVPAEPGTGQFGMALYNDKDGNSLIGGNTYHLHVPADVPVKQFWQIPIYSVSTRSMINTDQKKAALSSTGDLQLNDDGSVDLYFGPELPKGVDARNWIKTIPREGWFILPRLYAPLEAILNKTWRWNDVELVKAGKDQVKSTGAIPEYIGGYPTEETAEAMYEEYDYQAAVQFYIWGYAYLNSMGWEKGCARMGGNERSFYHWDKRVQSQHVVMTANAEVIYNWTRYIDLSKGLVVFEVPPRCRGHFYDMGMRAYVDIGDVGPDKGKGGKYLAVSADYKGKIPDGYFEVRSKYSDRILLGFRSFPASEGSDEAAVKLGTQAKWYYLSEAKNPPKNSHIMIGDRPFSQEWPRDEEAFAWLAEAFSMDKVPASGLAHMGNMRRLGIEKGKPFAPNARAKRILKRAAKTAEAMVLSMAFRNRLDGLIYDNRQYERYALNRSPIFFQEHYEEVEERAGGWHQLVGNFATYTPAKPGTGQFSMTTYRDKNGNALIGSHTYRLHVPAKVPVKQFWQIPIYEVATRSMIATDQKKSSLSSTQDLQKNPDGSVDLYFGPELPKGVSEKNWIKTIPGEGWFTLPRLYAPLEPILDKTWRWNDIEKVK